MNLGEHLNAIFTKAGVPQDDPALKDLVTKVATIEIKDELTEKFNQTYLTVEAAKHNPEIKKSFFATALNGVDTEVQNILQELQYGDEIKTEIEAEKNTYKKVGILAKKIKELESQKAGASKGEKAELSKQIEALNTEIKTVKENAKKETEAVKNDYQEKLKDVYLTQILSGFKYASDLAKDKDYLLPKTYIADALKEKKLRTVLDGKDFKLETESGTDYFENNSKVDFKTFTEKVLAQHKLPAVSETTQTTTQTQTITGNKKLDTSKFDARFNELQPNA